MSYYYQDPRHLGWIAEVIELVVTGVKSVLDIETASHEAGAATLDAQTQTQILQVAKTETQLAQMRADEAAKKKHDETMAQVQKYVPVITVVGGAILIGGLMAKKGKRR